MAEPPAARPLRLVYLVTSPDTARFLARGQLAFLRAHGVTVTLVSAPDEDLALVGEREAVAVAGVPMSREIRPLRDLAALVRLVRLLRRLRPDLINASTPKAAVLGMWAARLAAVPHRIYTNRGLRLETTTGWKRRLLGLAERTAVACAHQVICVSPSLRRRVIELGLAPPEKTIVLAPGSSNGVDCDHFRPEGPAGESAALRAELGLPAGARVIGAVGRLTRDKGIVDLVEAFAEVSRRLPASRLLLVGRFEAGDPLPDRLHRRLAEDERIVVQPFVPDAAPYYRVMDVLALPSYREGFPNAALEAAASGLPVAGYAATGTIDAVADGVTGTLVAPGSVAALGAALLRYLEDPELCSRHGGAGRARAVGEFRRELVWRAWLDHYRRLPVASPPE